MGCDIKFLIGDEEITVADTLLSATETSLENIAKLLLEDENVKYNIQDLIKKLKTNEVKQISKKDIEKGDLINNTTLEYLMKEYSVNWPEIVSDQSLKILLVKNLRLNKKVIHGRVLDKYGNELFILKDTINDIKKFANYIKVRELIQNYPESDEELLNIIKNLLNIDKNYPTTVKDLLQDFLNYPSKYEKTNYYGVLNDVLIGLLNYSAKSKYDNPFLNNINSLLNKRAETYSISKSLFYDLFKLFYGNTEEFKNLPPKKELLNDTKLFKNIIQEYFLNMDPELNYKIINITNKDIILSSYAETIENKYGFTYETLNLLVFFVENYNGYNIYQFTDDKGVTKYIYDRNKISLKTKTSASEDINKIKLNIDRRILTNDTLTNSSNIAFKILTPTGEPQRFFKIPNKLEEGTVVDSLDVPLKNVSNFLSDEQTILNGKLAEFYKYYENIMPSSLYSKVKKVINTSEKAAIFIYKLYEVFGTDRSWNYPEEVLDILNLIENANHKYFFIEKSIPGNYVKVIPVSDNVEYDEYFERPEPVIQSLKETIKVLKNKFGINAELITSEEILKNFKKDEIDITAKAFIKDGIIYINGSIASNTDAFHEYTHLVLGVLKATNYDMYMNLLEKLLSSNKMLIKLEDLKSRYKNRAYLDLAEEVFVEEFARHITGTNINSIFDDATKDINKVLGETIFNLATDEDFQNLYKGNLKNIFNLFSSDINKVGNGLDFSTGTVYRKAANWISLKLESGEIKEVCK